MYPPLIACILIGITLASCQQPSVGEPSTSGQKPLTGTWRLVSGTVIEKGDISITDYTKNGSFIKIINDTHFAFLQHDLNKGKDSAVFVAGGGAYSLTDSLYTEHLEYCTDRAWEGHDFSFTIVIRNDTLIQKGLEKVEAAGVERMNTETYVREKR